MNPELRYWQAVVRAAEAALDSANTNSDLKLAARRLMRARRYLASLLAQQHAPSPTQAPARRRRRPP